MTINNDLAGRIKSIRIARHISLSALSRVTGISKSYLHALEGGGVNPSIATVVALSEALEVSIEHLVFGTSNATKPTLSAYEIELLSVWRACNMAAVLRLVAKRLSEDGD